MMKPVAFPITDLTTGMYLYIQFYINSLEPWGYFCCYFHIIEGKNIAVYASPSIRFLLFCLEPYFLAGVNASHLKTSQKLCTTWESPRQQV